MCRAGTGADAHRALIKVRHAVAVLGWELPFTVQDVEIHQGAPAVSPCPPPSR
jgi:hypothetical protein